MPDSEVKPVITPVQMPIQDQKELQVILMKQRACRQAMVEIIQLNRRKIIQLAAKKLRALGIEVNENELELP